MLVAFDIDGTIDAAPNEFQSLMSSIRASGNDVVILTGCSRETVTQDDIETKTQYLQSLGVGNCYDSLVVFSHPPAEKKAQWIKENSVDILVDNSKENARAAMQYCLVLVPWATRK